MLVLSRRAGEVIDLIILPSDTARTIRIAAVEFRRGPAVRLAFEAPQDVRIIRSELLERPQTRQLQVGYATGAGRKP